MANRFIFDCNKEGGEVTMQDELDGDHTQCLNDNGNNMNLRRDDNNISVSSNNMLVDEQLGLRKRNREDDDQSGEWQNATRKHKKINTRNMSLSPPTQRAATPNQVATTCKTAFPKQFALAKLLRQHGISGVLKVKYVNPYKLLINFESYECAVNFINNVELTKIEWKRQNTAEVGLSFGIIRDIETDLSDDDLLNDIESEVDIASIKRLNRACPDGWTASECVRIGFKGSRMPPYIYLFGLRIKVSPYIFPVTQCSRCWRFGHTTKMCPANKPICPKCGERHSNCEAQNFTCANCKGDHLALSKKCPAYLKEKRIRELMRDFNCTYQKALDIFVPPSPTVSEMHVAAVQHSEAIHDTASDITGSHPTYSDATRNTPDTNNQEKVLIDTQRPSKDKGVRQKKSVNPAESTPKKMQSASNVGSDTPHERRDKPYHEDVSERSEEETQYLSELLERLKDLFFIRTLSWQEKIHSGFAMIKKWVLSYLVKILSELPLLKNVFGSTNG
jgi:hypothetical protein